MMLRRRLLAAALTTLAAAATLTVTAAPARAGGESPAYGITWAYTDSAQPAKSFVDAAGSAPVGRWQDGDGKVHTSRSYFTYDLSRYQGRQIHAANFPALETDAENCAKPAPVELWLTGPVTNRTTWRTPPVELSRVGTINMGAGQRCPDGGYGFDIAAEVRAAVAAGRSEITFGLRIAKGSERKGQLGRRFRADLALAVTANLPPATPANLSVESRTSGCGSREEPIYVGANPTFAARFDDPDGSPERINATFAWWPVDDETARQEAVAASQPLGLIRYQPSPEIPMPEGRYGWAARSNDGYDDSEWSQTCYFQIDRKVPAPPVVTSDDYPSDSAAHGGVGVPGIFRIDPNGSDDVVAYQWNMSGSGVGEVPAPQPGAGVELRLAPAKYGTNILTVHSIDRTGNRSSQVEYSFRVRNTAPEVTLDMGGVDLPSRLTMKPGVDGVTEYRYRVGDGPEVSVPAGATGSATAEISFTATGLTTVAVSNYTTAGLAGVWTETIRVTDAPRVASESYEGGRHHARLGEPFGFTFGPRRPDAVRYEYELDWDQPRKSVPASADGTATLTWTPTEPGYLQMMVRSVHGDGTTSEWAYEDVSVIDARPYVSAVLYNPDQPEGGVGVADFFMFQSDVDGVTEFVVRLNGGTEITTPAYGGTLGELVLAPDRAGENVLTVRARYEDGTLSPAREWAFLVTG